MFSMAVIELTPKRKGCRDHAGLEFGEAVPALGQPKRFLQPCLLLLIAESPAHGYDLLERLTEFGLERDPGGLYRALRPVQPRCARE